MYKNVIIVGATGYFIGTKITNAFLGKKDKFNTSILISKRAMQVTFSFEIQALTVVTFL
jgi:hypothetical protein